MSEEILEQQKKDMLKFINDTPALLSLLYDLDMMPEQTDSKADQARMFLIATQFKNYADSLEVQSGT